MACIGRLMEAKFTCKVDAYLVSESYDRDWPTNRCSKVKDEEIFIRKVGKLSDCANKGKTTTRVHTEVNMCWKRRFK